MSTNSSLEEKVAEFIRNGKSDAIEGKLIELSYPIFTSFINISLFKLIYQGYRVKLISKKKLSLRKLSSTYLFIMKEESSSYLGSCIGLGSFIMKGIREPQI